MRGEYKICDAIAQPLPSQTVTTTSRHTISLCYKITITSRGYSTYRATVLLLLLLPTLLPSHQLTLTTLNGYFLHLSIQDFSLN